MSDEISDGIGAPIEGIAEPIAAEPQPGSDLLPDEFMDRKVFVPKSGGREPMTVKEATEYARKGWQVAASKDATISELKQRAATLEQFILNQQPPAQPAHPDPSIGPRAEDYDYMDPATKEVFNYLEKINHKIQNIEGQYSQDKQRQMMQAAQQAEAQNMELHTQALMRGIESFKGDISNNSDVAAVISEAITIRRNTYDPDEARMFDSDPATLYKKAAERVVGEIRRTTDRKVESRLMQLREGLERGDVAAVEGAGGAAPLPTGNTTNPESYDEKAADYAKRFENLQRIEQAKSLGLGGRK